MSRPLQQVSETSPSAMPERIWARIRGGGVSLPSGKPYLSFAAEDREMEKATEYVRADLAKVIASEALDLVQFANCRTDEQERALTQMRLNELRAQLAKLAGENNG